MKKLLALLFSLLISFNSYAERIYCSYVNDYGTVTLIDFWKTHPNGITSNEQKWLVNNSQPFWDTGYESDASLVLQKYSQYGFLSAYINKKNKKFIFTYIGINGDLENPNFGKCKFD